MLIGFDFDNTIVSYDTLFHRVARQQGVVPETLPVNKLAVRDYLRSIDQEDVWTEMQGEVYGAHMLAAEAYPGVKEVMKNLTQAGHTLAIVSHKTQYPYAGKPHDLHKAARQWIAHHLCEAGEGLIPEDHVFFEATKAQKIERIAHIGCDVFIDDLPEILLAPQFPTHTRRFLFDPEEYHAHTVLQGISRITTWREPGIW